MLLVSEDLYSVSILVLRSSSSEVFFCADSVFGVALTFVLKVLHDRNLKPELETQGLPATKGSLGNNVSIIVLCGLAGFIFTLYLTNFVSRRSIGIFNIMVYLIALVFNFLCEFGFMHAFGADHTTDNTD